MKAKRFLATLLSSMLLMGSFAACNNNSGGESTDSPTSGTEGSQSVEAGSGQVYFLNFKPEQEAAYLEIATEYTEKTGVPVKVVTAAAGTYEQQLRSEMAKNEAPTIFQINGPVGYNSWKQYTADIKDSEIYSHLSDKSLAITDGDGVFGIPFAIEGYGIIVNNKIMAEYFALDGAKASDMNAINSFQKLKEVVEDMQARKDELGIDGVFASTSLMSGEDWRWQTHLSNVPLYYEFQANNTDLSDPAASNTIAFTYNENFKNIFDLYLNNSTVAPTMTGAKTVGDSMAEFALGQAAMVQNGNWAYGQIAGVEGNIVAEEDVSFMPIYIGMTGEETQGLCIGTENFFCINKEASAENQQASLDFLNWLYTSDEGKAHVTYNLGFIAPFDSFSDADKPADPLGQQIMDWSAKDGIKNVPWNFTIYPSQQFKNDFGGNLLLYAQGQKDWNVVAEEMVSGWAAEKAATAQ